MTITATLPLCLTPADKAACFPREAARRGITMMREQRQLGFTPDTSHLAKIFRGRQDVAITPATVRVGMGATRVWWTDSDACEVVAVSKTGTRITLRPMKATLDRTKWTPDFHPGGFVGHVANDRDQVYILEQDPTAKTFVATWAPKKGKYTSGSCRVYVRLHAGTQFHDNNF
jgi:hypothetical protein